MNEKQMKYEILNRRQVGQDQFARIRQDGNQSFGILLHLLRAGGLTEREACNALICLSALLRAFGVTDEQRSTFADLLVHLGRTGSSPIRERATGVARSIVGIDELLRTPMFGRDTIASLEALVEAE